MALGLRPAAMNILFNEGNRHTQLSGYGNLSRSIMTALAEHTDAILMTRFRDYEIPDWVRDKELLEQIPVAENNRDHDVVLRISQPPSKPIPETKPMVFYTQNAIGDLIPDWVEFMKAADGFIVPSEFDAEVFRRYFNNVSVCHQHVDERMFTPRPVWRAEGTDEFSFLFVGSYGYRKGVDLLLDAFEKAFDAGQKVNLTLHCFSGFEYGNFNDLLKWHRRVPDNISLTIFNGTVEPDWMCRHYNRHDCIVTFSRGEGWCMPLHEALLCGKPVICPASTAMGECLPDRGVIKVPVEEKLISEITDPWGLGFRSATERAETLSMRFSKKLRFRRCATCTITMQITRLRPMQRVHSSPKRTRRNHSQPRS